MLPTAMTRAIIRSLDWLAARTLPPDKRPAHQRTGQRGEEDAYFFLRKLGYIIVARNFRSPRCHGKSISSVGTKIFFVLLKLKLGPRCM